MAELLKFNQYFCCSCFLYRLVCAWYRKLKSLRSHCGTDRSLYSEITIGNPEMPLTDRKFQLERPQILMIKPQIPIDQTANFNDHPANWN